jgi:hypothetical protein
VRTGNGRKKMARSVMILRGADDRYSVTISVHCEPFGMGVLKAELYKILVKFLSELS